MLSLLSLQGFLFVTTHNTMHRLNAITGIYENRKKNELMHWGLVSFINIPKLLYYYH
jgi:hypothetical protein